jgi:hypothetical protein
MCNCSTCRGMRSAIHAGSCSCRGCRRSQREALLGDEFGGRRQLFAGPSPQALMRYVPSWSGWVYGGNTLASIRSGQRVSNFTPRRARQIPLYAIVSNTGAPVYLGFAPGRRQDALEQRIRRHRQFPDNFRVFAGTAATPDARLAHVVESLLQRHYGRPVYIADTWTFDEADESEEAEAQLERIVGRQLTPSLPVN